jgi:hypothetical protein
MLVRYLVSEAGPRHDYQPGQIIDLPARDAKLAIRVGKAELVKESAENAARTGGENASMPHSRGREA